MEYSKEVEAMQSASGADLGIARTVLRVMSKMRWFRIFFKSEIIDVLRIFSW